MESDEPIVVGCETSKNKKKNRPKMIWDMTIFMAFLELCMEELKKGNKPNSTFNKHGYKNLMKGMLEKTSKVFDRQQLKNKLDIMKKDWKLYDKLMRLETGIGGSRNLLEASSEWWDEKIKVNNDFAKFRDANLEIYDMYYAPLFQDSVAVGDQAMAPAQFQKNNTPNNSQFEDNMEGQGDSEENNIGEDEPLFPSFPQSSATKRKKKDGANTRSTKTKTTSYEQKLDVVIEALSARSTQTYPPNNPIPTIAECMKIVTTFPGFEEGSQLHPHALKAFTQKENREAFMVSTSDEAKMNFLKLLLK